MAYQNLRLEFQQAVAVVTIDHAPVNALNQQTLQELSELIDVLEQTPEIKVIVLTGAGRCFIAGADIREIKAMHGDQKQATAMSTAGQRLFSKMEGLTKPIIATINGPCLGGGLELAMSCHIRLAAREAKLGLPELQLGVIPGYGGTQRLVRLIGRGKATELILTSQPVTAEEGLRLGLVEAVYPGEELLTEATKLALQIAEKSMVAVRLALSAIAAASPDNEQRGMEQEAALFGEACVSADMREGVTAFLEKRKPQFIDR